MSAASVPVWAVGLLMVMALIVGYLYTIAGQWGCCMDVDLPVTQSTTFQFVLNLKTAKPLASTCR